MYCFSRSTTFFANSCSFSRMKNPYCASNFSTLQLTFSGSIVFSSNKPACDLGPSREPRMIRSPFVSVLIPRQILWKDAEIVDRRDVTKKKNFAFRGFNLSLSVFSASTIF